MSLLNTFVGKGMKVFVLLTVLCVHLTICFGKPLVESAEKNAVYKDTEEILSDWANDDDSYDYSSEEEQQEGPIIRHLPPVFVELGETIKVSTPAPTTTSTTTTVGTTTHKPVFFPNTAIELGPIFEQVAMARRKERVEPVDLPVPYIVWARDSSETGNNRERYWKQVYNTAYTVE